VKENAKLHKGRKSSDSDSDSDSESSVEYKKKSKKDAKKEKEFLKDLDKILHGKVDEFVSKYHSTPAGLDDSDLVMAQMLAYEDGYGTKGGPTTTVPWKVVLSREEKEKEENKKDVKESDLLHNHHEKANNNGSVDNISGAPFELKRQDSLLLQLEKEEKMLKQMIDEQQKLLYQVKYGDKNKKKIK